MSYRVDEGSVLPVWLVIIAGIVFVNLPLIPIMMASAALVMAIVLHLPFLSNVPGWVVLVYFLLAACAALLSGWCYWAFTIERWKHWARSRVIDFDGLKKTAVAVGLIWPSWGQGW